MHLIVANAMIVPGGYLHFDRYQWSSVDPGMRFDMRPGKLRCEDMDMRT